MSNCLNCKKEIEAHTGRRPKKFCSDACRQSYHNSQKSRNYVTKATYEAVLEENKALKAELAILSQNKPVEGNVQQTDDVSNLGRKKRSDDKKYENNVKDAGNWTGDVDVAAKIEELQRAANSCADTKLGRLAKANYEKQINEWKQSLLK